MAKPFNAWTVLPHGKLTQLDDNLLDRYPSIAVLSIIADDAALILGRIAKDMAA